MKKNVFLTGATGLLGTHLLRLFLKETTAHIFLLIRGRNKEIVNRKYSELVKRMCVTSPSNNVSKRITLVRGDVSERNLGIAQKERRKVYRHIDEIYHCAAITGFRLPLDIARRINVGGTRNVLDFASKCKQNRSVHYISTAYICGKKSGVFNEYDNISEFKEFNNTYEQSKLEAERVISQRKGRNFKVSIYRPSIITGEYRTGETHNFKMFYEPLRFFSKELFEKIPADQKSLHNLIPVDIAAKSIFVLAQNEKNGGIYHITSPNNITYSNFMKSASDYFGYKNPRFCNREKFEDAQLTIVQKKILEPFVPYFNYKAIFGSEATKVKLQKYDFRCPRINKLFLKRLFKFCEGIGFIKQKR